MDFKSCLFIFTWLSHTVTPMSIEKHIMDSAKNAEMFDMFHVMPDGMVKVFHELDMVLSLDQYKQLYMDHNHRQKRKASAAVTNKWTNCTVFYEIAESLDTGFDRGRIKSAMDLWEKYTCLDFKEDDRAPNRIQFKDGEGCSSAVGMIKGLQEIHLASGCRTRGVIAHEIGHAIGWYHEQNRPDRDDFLLVNFDVIPEKYKGNYNKYNTDEIDAHGVGYDYTSIMHYGADAIKDSLIALDPRYQDKMGQRDGFSFKDIKLANVMYDCANIMKCPKLLKQCPHGGFQLYKSLKGVQRCECWCDSGNVSDPLILCSKVTTTISPQVVTLPPVTAKPVMPCLDLRPDCKELKKAGKCMTKMALMKSNCMKTCGFCGKGEHLCMDYEPGCGLMTRYCNDPGLASTMNEMCKVSCDKCLKPPDPCEIMKEMMGDHHENDNQSRGNAYTDRGSGLAVVISSSAVIIATILTG